ncbi:hypothetical protein AB0I28_12680 [Phytomonospora sp. NPDC050363]|uniref:hypothetical protein n=1 Tax=Phytomonospora sp. NPDC050363 TaxID=3155642 RepID=UPI0033E6EA73
MTHAHTRRWIMRNRWQYQPELGPPHIVEYVVLEGGRYGVLWARGDQLRVRGGMDRQDAETAAKEAREKIAPDGAWVDMSIL